MIQNIKCCTETTPCQTDFGPCAWTDRMQTLCTVCVNKVPRAPKKKGKRK
jgi:hypothetical protein